MCFGVLDQDKMVGRVKAVTFGREQGDNRWKSVADAEPDVPGPKGTARHICGARKPVGADRAVCLRHHPDPQLDARADKPQPCVRLRSQCILGFIRMPHRLVDSRMTCLCQVREHILAPIPQGVGRSVSSFCVWQRLSRAEPVCGQIEDGLEPPSGPGSASPISTLAPCSGGMVLEIRLALAPKRCIEPNDIILGVVMENVAE